MPATDSYDDGLRPCARGHYCASRNTDGPALGPRAFCDADSDLIGQSLKWLPHAYVELHLRLGDSNPDVAGRVSGTPVVSGPVNLTIHEAMREMVDILGSWDERVRDAAGEDEEDHRQRDAVYLSRTVASLTAHRETLLGLPPAEMIRLVPTKLYETMPAGSYDLLRADDSQALLIVRLDGADAGDEVLRLHRRCRKILGLTPRHRRLDVRCWNCGVLDVHRRDGYAGLDDIALCRNCGEDYTAAHYARALAQATEHVIDRIGDAS